MEKVAEAVKELPLSEQRLARLETAVAESTMNAMEHATGTGRRCPSGSRYGSWPSVY